MQRVGQPASAIKSCRRGMELRAYRAEAKVVNKRLSELKAMQAKGPVSTEGQISLRVLEEMKREEDEIFMNPTLLIQ